VTNPVRIAGAYSGRQLLRLKLRAGLPCLLVGVLGLWGSQHQLQKRSPRFPFDRLTRIEVTAFFPLLAAFTYVWSRRSDGWRVTEFTCDEHSFRFRKLRGEPVNRDLAEIVQVRKEYIRTLSVKGCPGYTVRFRDGEEVLLALNLPNVDALAGWLEGHTQAGPHSAKRRSISSSFP